MSIFNLSQAEPWLERVNTSKDIYSVLEYPFKNSKMYFGVVSEIINDVAALQYDELEMICAKFRGNETHIFSFT